MQFAASVPGPGSPVAVSPAGLEATVGRKARSTGKLCRGANPRSQHRQAQGQVPRRQATEVAVERRFRPLEAARGDGPDLPPKQ